MYAPRTNTCLLTFLPDCTNRSQDGEFEQGDVFLVLEPAALMLLPQTSILLVLYRVANTHTHNPVNSWSTKKSGFVYEVLFL